MKSHFLLSSGVAMACAVTGASSLTTATADAQTLAAADYATNSAYADGWQEGDNGGFGFTTNGWSFYGTYTSAVQHAMNSTSPYNHLGLAWTLFLPVGAGAGTPNPPPPPPPPTDLSRAGRGFPPLQVGQTITTVFDNPTEQLFGHGYTILLVSGGQNIGYCCTGATKRLRVGTYEYNSYGRWYVDDSSSPPMTSLFDTNTAAAGASLAVTLTGPNNYKMVLTPLSNPSLAFTNSGTLLNSGPIDWIEFEHYNTDSDFFNATNGVTYTNVVSPAKATDFYIRSITITTVQPVAPAIVQQPAPRALHPGRNAKFNVGAIGTSLSYHWRKNGTNLTNGGSISGALTDTLVVSNVSAGDVAAYTVVVTNSVGAVTSAPPANLTLVPPTGTPYETAVLAANPVAYWRLNEIANPATNPPAYDYASGLAGYYGTNAQNGFTNIAGPLPSDGFPGLESTNKALQLTANTAQSWVTIPALNLNTNALTFTFWVYPYSDTLQGYTGLVYTRRGSTPAAGVQYTTFNMVGYTINDDPDTWSWNSFVVTPGNQWSFVAVVLDPTQGTVYVANTNGFDSAIKVSTNAPYPNIVWDGIGWLGADPDNNLNRTLNGKMDEVAIFNYAFTPQQVTNLYNAALGAVPTVTLTIEKVGANVRLTWPQGTLLEATNVSGAWTTNSATSPYTTAPTGSKKFYRVVVH